MKVKFANKIYDVLYTMKVLGKSIYAVEDEPNHIDWLVNVEVINEDEESEDERIRKELTDYIKSKFENSCSPTPSKNILGNWITWLEKQNELSIKWNKNAEESKPPVNHSILMKTTHGIAEGEWKGGESWYQYRWKSHVKDSDVLAWMELSDLDKQDEQKPTWSEDDELMQKDALEFIETGWSNNGKSHLVYWLKSIKDRIK